MPVSLKKTSLVARRLKELGIHERDLFEQFIRSSGKGGQHVNKTSTCVLLRHIPTGVEVRCQSERSQAINRHLARARLADKIERMQLGRASREEQRRWKLKKQKRRRSRRAKEKVLEHKRKQSEKKELRKPPSREE
ncbi:MAG: peptide chain release factor-like protein [Proteobacteria bacterium]|nr:peptide chain release factor-like protein [Pseudomonadota bacterium]